MRLPPIQFSEADQEALNRGRYHYEHPRVHFRTPIIQSR